MVEILIIHIKVRTGLYSKAKTFLLYCIDWLHHFSPSVGENLALFHASSQLPIFSERRKGRPVKRNESVSI